MSPLAKLYYSCVLQSEDIQGACSRALPASVGGQGSAMVRFLPITCALIQFAARKQEQKCPGAISFNSGSACLHLSHA